MHVEAWHGESMQQLLLHPFFPSAVDSVSEREVSSPCLRPSLLEGRCSGI